MNLEEGVKKGIIKLVDTQADVDKLLNEEVETYKVWGQRIVVDVKPFLVWIWSRGSPCPSLLDVWFLLASCKGNLSNDCIPSSRNANHT